MKLHEVIGEGPGFDAVRCGQKKALFRLDRGFGIGDVIWLRQWFAEGERAGWFDGDGSDREHGFLATGYTGKDCLLRVTHVQEGGIYGMPAGYAMLSVERVELVAV